MTISIQISSAMVNLYNRFEAILNDPKYKVNMGKLVLGIAAVICLDIAFIAYLYTTQEPELRASASAPANARKPRPPKIAFPLPADQPSVISEPAEPVRSVISENSTLIARRVKRKTVKRNELAKVPRKSRIITAARSHHARKTDRTYAISAPPRGSDVRVVKDETETTILYIGPRTSSEASTAPFQKPAKRSFTSRAVAIVKKPWTWLKAAGSKMF